jgi:hypothetical protein
MRREHRYLALVLAAICGLAFTHLARAQDSFLERFIRAGGGAPPPGGSAKPRPSVPTIRHRYVAPSGARPAPRYAAPAYPARRIGRSSGGAKEAADEPIKTKTNPSTAILVIGDALADRLAQGIDQEFADNPDIQVVRKTKPVSSLTRSDLYDWVDAARTAVSGPQHFDVAVILVGINDWQPMQSGGATLEAGSDAWREAYGKRVEALLNVFKDKNVPVVWVGLPVMSLPKYSEQLQTLNTIVRGAVTAKGGTFVDLHDAFTGEDGKYTDTGPSLNGAVVKLRSSDGVSFTKAGALKAAYFADVEVKRILGERPAAAPDALVASPAGPPPASPPASPGAPSPAGPGKGAVERLIDQMAGTPLPADPVPLIARLSERPLAGPVFSLTSPERTADGQLLSPSTAPRPMGASFTGGLLSAPKPGRSDDFSWRSSP